jgi:hypothetical protein
MAGSKIPFTRRKLAPPGGSAGKNGKCVKFSSQEHDNTGGSAKDYSLNVTTSSPMVNRNPQRF